MDRLPAPTQEAPRDHKPRLASGRWARVDLPSTTRGETPRPPRTHRPPTTGESPRRRQSIGRRLGLLEPTRRTPSRRTPASRQAPATPTGAVPGRPRGLQAWRQNGSRSPHAQSPRREGYERQPATGASTLSREENSQPDWLPRYA